MGHIDDLPNDVPQAGKGANVTGVTTARVELVYCPLDPDYINTAINQDAVNSYIYGEINEGRGLVFQTNNLDPNAPLKAPLPFVDAMKYNYARVVYGSKPFYYFLELDYRNQNVTQYTRTMDNCTTWGMRLGPSFLERGHLGVAATVNDEFGDNCLEPEPIATGDLIAADVSSWDALGDVDIVVISTIGLTPTQPFRKAAIGQEPYVRIPMEEITHNLGRGTDEVKRIRAHVSGNIDAGLWPFPADPYAYEAGVNLSAAEVEPMNWPWVDGNDAMIPNAPPVAPSTINGVPVEGGVYVYRGFAEYARHMSILAHTPWITAGIQDVYPIPQGLYGDAGAGTSNTPVSLANRDYDATMALIAEGSTLASYKSSVNYSTSAQVNLRDNWRGLFNAGIYKKLNTSQFASVEFTDRNGSAMTIPPEQLRSSNASFSMNRTAMNVGEITAWPDNYPGGSESPIHVGYAMSLPRWDNGRDTAIMRGAASWIANRSIAVWKYLAEARNKAYSKYASQATDGYNTAFNYQAGQILGVKNS